MNHSRPTGLGLALARVSSTCESRTQLQGCTTGPGPQGVFGLLGGQGRGCRSSGVLCLSCCVTHPNSSVPHGPAGGLGYSGCLQADMEAGMWGLFSPCGCPLHGLSGPSSRRSHCSHGGSELPQTVFQEEGTESVVFLAAGPKAGTFCKSLGPGSSQSQPGGHTRRCGFGPPLEMSSQARRVDFRGAQAALGVQRSPELGQRSLLRD